MKHSEMILQYVELAGQVNRFRQELEDLEAKLEMRRMDICADDKLAKMLTDTGIRTHGNELLIMDNDNLLIRPFVEVPATWSLDDDG